MQIIFPSHTWVLTFTMTYYFFIGVARCENFNPKCSGLVAGGQRGGEAVAAGQGEDPLHLPSHTAHEQLLRIC
jgi:hypothetical protein